MFNVLWPTVTIIILRQGVQCLVTHSNHTHIHAGFSQRLLVAETGGGEPDCEGREHVHRESLACCAVRACTLDRVPKLPADLCALSGQSAPVYALFVVISIVVLGVEDIIYEIIIITVNITNITVLEDVPLVEFMYLVFTRMPGESYRRRLRSLLLCLCYVFRALINSLVC